MYAHSLYLHKYSSFMMQFEWKLTVGQFINLVKHVIQKTSVVLIVDTADLCLCSCFQLLLGI
jgi:hypothetical protein